MGNDLGKLASLALGAAGIGAALEGIKKVVESSEHKVEVKAETDRAMQEAEIQHIEDMAIMSLPEPQRLAKLHERQLRIDAKNRRKTIEGKEIELKALKEKREKQKTAAIQTRTESEKPKKKYPWILIVPCVIGTIIAAYIGGLGLFLMMDLILAASFMIIYQYNSTRPTQVQADSEFEKLQDIENDIDKLESKIETMENELARIEEELAHPEYYQ